MADNRPRRGKAGLDLTTVLDTAEAVVDRVGWDALTMSALARELGVRAPSLYHHVKSIEAVRGELQARTLAAMATALRGTRGALHQAGDEALATRNERRTRGDKFAGTVRAAL